MFHICIYVHTHPSVNLWLNEWWEGGVGWGEGGASKTTTLSTTILMLMVMMMVVMMEQKRKTEIHNFCISTGRRQKKSVSVFMHVHTYIRLYMWRMKMDQYKRFNKHTYISIYFLLVTIVWLKIKYNKIYIETERKNGKEKAHQWHVDYFLANKKFLYYFEKNEFCVYLFAMWTSQEEEEEEEAGPYHEKCWYTKGIGMGRGAWKFRRI